MVQTAAAQGAMPDIPLCPHTGRQCPTPAWYKQTPVADWPEPLGVADRTRTQSPLHKLQSSLEWGPPITESRLPPLDEAANSESESASTGTGTGMGTAWQGATSPEVAEQLLPQTVPRTREVWSWAWHTQGLLRGWNPQRLEQD